MNMMVTPGVAENPLTSEDSVFNLINLISDPKTHAKRLEQLKKVKDEALASEANFKRETEKFAGLSKAQKEAEELIKKYEDKHKELKDLETQYQDALNSFEKTKSNFKNEVEKTHKEVEDRRVNLAWWESSLKDRDKSTAAIQERANEELAKASDLRKDLESRLAKLKAIAI